MTLGTFVVGALLAVIVGRIIVGMVRDKKNGRSISCGGDCPHCGGRCH